ncbi:hypothetical protein CRYUN_Cryun04dG0160400 [Craigia yunnanensis]
MLSLKNIPSTTLVLSTYTTFTASAMLVRSVVSEVQAITSQLIQKQLQTILLSKLGGLCSNPSSQMTLLIDEYDRYSINELYKASEIYLQTKIATSMERLKVLSSYLPYVMERAKAIEEENKVVKLFSLGNFCGDNDGAWGSTNLDHPVTFDKLAMDPTLKKKLIEDLDRFVRRRDFYKRVGKAWKRGNLELRSLLVSTRNRSIIVIEDIDCSIELQERLAGSVGYEQANQVRMQD